MFLNPANLFFVTICHRVNYMYNGKKYFTLKGNNLPGMFMLHPLIHFNLSSELDSSDCNAIVQITQYLIKSTKSWAMGFIVISTSCLKLLLTPIVALKIIKTFKFHCHDKVTIIAWWLLQNLWSEPTLCSLLSVSNFVCIPQNIFLLILLCCSLALLL